MLKFQVFCVGHIQAKSPSCLTCIIDNHNLHCDKGYEPVSCLGHLSKDRCPGCFNCSAEKMPEQCLYAKSLHNHDAIAFKYIKARIPATIEHAQKASPPDSSCYLG